MPVDRPTDDVDLDRLERLFIVLSILGFALAIRGLVGKLLGGWNDLGALFIPLGTVAGVATGVVAILVDATKEPVRHLADGVEGNGAQLDKIHEDHGDKLDRIYNDHGARLDRIWEDHGAKLDRIHDDLEGLQRGLTEAVEQQHDVLLQIREGL